jgi:hypothetical protein
MYVSLLLESAQFESMIVISRREAGQDNIGMQADLEIFSTTRNSIPDF